MPEMPDWQRFLSDDDRTTIERGRWAKRVGFGAHPAVILIDVQNYMVGEKGHHDLGAYPYSCASGWAAVEQTKRIVGAARAARTPVIYTRFAIDRTVGDAGLFDAKIGAEAGENVYFEGTHGSEIVDAVAPEPGDLVFTKKKPSSFHGTPLLPYLIDRAIDTLIVTGGATCNCVRATVFDAFSYNYRTIVPADAVFDRLPISHEINLFDMNRCSADVTDTEAVLAYFADLAARAA